MTEAIRIFDQKYVGQGASSQRRYPNESFIRFMSSNYFPLSYESRKKLRILDLGCGAGSNLWVLDKEGFEVHGIDGSLQGLVLSKETTSFF